MKNGRVANSLLRFGTVGKDGSGAAMSETGISGLGELWDELT